jgi:RNA polymerase sigma factor (sigma-70 family)
MLEDTLLRVRFNRGDRSALPRIYEKYKHELVTLATALLQDKSRAEDAVHDVFVSLLEPNRQLRIKQTLKGYLTTAVANRARTAARKATAVGRPSIKAGTYTNENSSPIDGTVFGEQRRHLVRALAQLPYEQREVILLRMYSGLRFKAIAESQEVSINTVQGRYRYGLEKLRSILDGELK